MKSRILVLALPLLLASCSVNVVPKTSDSRSQTTSSQAASESKPAESSEKEASSAKEDSSMVKESSEKEVSSAKEDSSMIEESSEEKAPSFIEQEGTAYYVNSIFNENFKYRYYEGGHVAYISIKEFNRLLYRSRTFVEGRDRFDVSKDGDVYTTTVAGGYTGIFDVKNNTFHADDLFCYKATHLSLVGIDSVSSYDGLPFIRIKDTKLLGEQQTSKVTNINFSDYHMKIYGDETNVYVPITFASDLFSNGNILTGAFNGKDLYFYDYTGNEDPTFALNKNYWENMFSSPIEEDQAQFLYYELCLDYDNFLGRPGRSSLEQYYDLSEGLDAALESRPLGKIIKGLLTSTSIDDYMAGCYLLGMLRKDGGHTAYNPLYAYYVEDEKAKNPDWLIKNYTNFSNKVTNISKANYEEIVNSCESFAHHREIYDSRERVLGKAGTCYGEKGYTKVDDVAFIHVDGFMKEIECQKDWAAYYKHETDTIPFDKVNGGAVAITFNALKESQKDPAIKYIVLDLSANTGGSTDEMITMISLIAGADKNSFYINNTVSGITLGTDYDIDRNFDRVFDEEDNKIDYIGDKKIGVLTTRNGFSCGGISPIYLHEYGLLTIGENCGGGSCSILVKPDAYGLNYHSSSPFHTVTAKGVSIDVARNTSCDYVMNFPANQVGGKTVYNYDELFNVSELKTVIDAKYAK